MVSQNILLSIMDAESQLKQLMACIASSTIAKINVEISDSAISIQMVKTETKASSNDVKHVTAVKAEVEEGEFCAVVTTA